MTNSKQKGKRIELLAADAIRKAWGVVARRSAQAAGNLAADLLHDVPGLHIEVKGRASIACIRWLEQAEEECLPNEVPIVLMKEDHDRDGFILMVRLNESKRLAEKLVDRFMGMEDRPR